MRLKNVESVERLRGSVEHSNWICLNVGGVEVEQMEGKLGWGGGGGASMSVS